MMIPDLESPADIEIEDLWPAFLATHSGLQIPNPLTRQAYNTLAPILGPWLMATQGLAAAMAQVGLESIWSVLAGLHGPAVSHRFHALYAVLRTPSPRWAAPFDRAVGYDGVLFAYPAILAALQLDGDRAEILAEREDVREAMARVALWHVTTADGVQHVAVSLTDVVDRLSPLATLPACQWLWQWIRAEYAPAIARHGYYDPAHGHAVPVGYELDALERREGARELLNDLLPGLGDATLAAGTAAPGTDA